MSLGVGYDYAEAPGVERKDNLPFTVSDFDEAIHFAALYGLNASEILAGFEYGTLGTPEANLHLAQFALQALTKPDSIISHLDLGADISAKKIQSESK